jgi:FkbM family methyltransferase
MILSWIKSVVRSAGYEPLRSSVDPVLQDLLDQYRNLRLAPDDPIFWEDRLSIPAASSHLRNLLRTKAIDLIIDIGANVGQFATRVRRLGYSGEIVSFEPTRSARAILETVAADDPKWTVRPEALGKQAGKGTIEVFADSTFSSLHAMNDRGRERFGGLVNPVGREVIEIVPLDLLREEIISNGNRRILLKTDTQGHDREVLLGAAATLRDSVAVVSEASARPIYAGAAKLTDLIREMEHQGFALSGIFPTGHETAPSLALIEVDCYFVRVTATTP